MFQNRTIAKSALSVTTVGGVSLYLFPTLLGGSMGPIPSFLRLREKLETLLVGLVCKWRACQDMLQMRKLCQSPFSQVTVVTAKSFRLPAQIFSSHHRIPTRLTSCRLCWARKPSLSNKSAGWNKTCRLENLTKFRNFEILKWTGMDLHHV